MLDRSTRTAFRLLMRPTGSTPSGPVDADTVTVAEHGVRNVPRDVQRRIGTFPETSRGLPELLPEGAPS
jgi:hypothetical protein